MTNGNKGLAWAGAFVLLAVAGCSSTPELGDSSSLGPLEVPPGLSKPRTTEEFAVPSVTVKAKADVPCPEGGVAANVLPSFGSRVSLMRDGQARWLVIEAMPEQVWPSAKAYLAKAGFVITKDDPTLGVLETDWRALAPNWREQFTLRVERGLQGGTEVHVSQRQTERGPEAGQEAWLRRAPEPERVNEVIAGLAQFLGAQDLQSREALPALVWRVERMSEGYDVLVVESDFERVWARAGAALERMGFTIRDRDRANRLYEIYHDLPGVDTARAARPEEAGKPPKPIREEYQIYLNTQGETVQVIVKDVKGRIDASGIAKHLLLQLGAQM